MRKTFCDMCARECLADTDIADVEVYAKGSSFMMQVHWTCLTQETEALGSFIHKQYTEAAVADAVGTMDKQYRSDWPEKPVV